MSKKEKTVDKIPFVGIPSSLGGIFLVIVVLFLIFAKESMWILVPIVWAFVVLGVFTSFFVYLAERIK
ncbi:hypothetical protein AYK26_06175 [Euryarchaeota archaeon SM23-78]|nr:MAG: hypothetical protein AYK26_06175 [Euryarchaeota archaeon SM23-78]MBW3001213.1 hypothetical protein [Candidatus Woesearchaeota archaeon]